MDEFHSTNSALSSFVISIFILGYAFGPLFIAPLSEMFGRLYVYHVSNILFTIFLIACGKSTSLGMLIAFRFLAGIPGSTPVTLGGATAADIFAPQQRGKAMAVWSLGPIIGNYTSTAR
jgi:MFS family permease